MERDNQHLDFLISQYVDGCLEGSNKKLVEQKMLTNPAARRLYAEHRETQDLLDDWGSRIPLINWEDFDKNLAVRLEAEAQEKERVSLFRRRMKPLAAAAALLLAVGLGYMWHAMSQGTTAAGRGQEGPVTVSVPRTNVEQMDLRRANAPSHAGMEIVESGAAGLKVAKGTAVEVSAPPEATAYTSLMDNVEYGLGHPDSAPARVAPNGAVAVGVQTGKEEGETPR
jgi:anti-sigma factor RsiW